MALNMLISGREEKRTMQDQLPNEAMFGEETREYLASHPELADRLRKAEKAYRIFGRYLNLTQSRIIVHESGGSTSEADLSATILRTDL
jgi:hypothetical protein